MKITGAVLEEIGRLRPYAKSQPITVSELDLAPPGESELLVRVQAAGVCHSDLSVVDGNRVRPVPMLLGHEASGVVAEVGDGVTDIVPGQRVIMTFLPRCGECAPCQTRGRVPCATGSASNNAGDLLAGGGRLTRAGQEVKHHLGVSGFATHCVVDRRSVVVVDDDVPPEVAAVLGCAVLTGGGALINAARPERGQKVAVIGLGGVGMAALITAVGLEGCTVIGVDGVDDKLAMASRLGADHVFRRTIIGSYLGSAVPERDIPVFVDLWRRGRLPVEELISSVITLEDLNSAMDALADGKAVRQVVLFPGED